MENDEEIKVNEHLEDTKQSDETLVIEFIEQNNKNSIKMMYDSNRQAVVKYVNDELQKHVINAIYYYPLSSKLFDVNNQQTHIIVKDESVKKNIFESLQIYYKKKFLQYLFVENESFVEFIDARNND
eukprot:427892_1